MHTKRHLAFAALLATMLALTAAHAPGDMPTDEAWKALPAYEHGEDMAPLLAIDRAGIEAMATPETRAAYAARLAALLENPNATLDAKHYACLQLRQAGTPAEVPILAKALQVAGTSDMARHALQAIPGEESLAVLRAALAEMQGEALVGVVNSLGARADERSVPALKSLAGHEDEQLADAAVRALGNIADESSTAVLLARADSAGGPMSRTLAVALLRCANSLAASGKEAEAEAIYRKLTAAGQPAGVRRAAFEALLASQKAPVAATVKQWITADDPAQRRVAAGHVDVLSDAELEALLDRLHTLDEATQTLLVQMSVERKGGQTLQLAIEMAKDENEGMKLAGVRILGQAGDPAVIPVLLDALEAGGPVTDAARDALIQLPRSEVAPALLAALAERPAIRVPVITILGRMKNYDAIDPLLELAEQESPETYGPALDGLRMICDPDKSDIPRLVKLLLRSRPGRHADEVERTILVVCEKLPPDADRSELVLAALRGVADSEAPKYLPLLGRLGGAEARKRIDAALAGADPAVREAAVRALCNWPNAEVADQLLAIARDDENRTFKRWALRAFVRVVSLKSDRPEAETLAMLQEAMRLAENDEDRQLVLERAGNVRIMEAVDWIASHLDNPALAQAACRALVELAHHRFLRHPNMDRFRPILKRIAEISKDRDVAERAARYEQGL